MGPPGFDRKDGVLNRWRFGKFSINNYWTLNGNSTVVAASVAAQPKATVIPFIPSQSIVAEQKGDMTIEELFADMGVEVEEDALAA